MSFKQRRMLLGGISVFAYLFLQSISLANEPVTGATMQSPVNLKFGAVPSLLYLPVYIAIENGYFKKRNINVEIINVSNPVPALIAGDVDFLMRSADASILAAAQGKYIPAVVMLQQRTTFTLNLSSRLREIAGSRQYPANIRILKGKMITVGISARGSTSEFLVKRAFSDAEMAEGKDYTMVVLGSGANLVTALVNGRVDAVSVWPPFSQAAEASGAPALVVNYDEAGVAVLTNTTFIAQRRDVVENVIAAIVEAEQFNRDVEKNIDALITIAKKYAGASDDNILLPAIKQEASLAYPGVDCAAWEVAFRNQMSAGTLTRQLACSDVVADIAPKGPIGP